MGNHASCPVPDGKAALSIRLIRSDGGIEVLDKTMYARDIMQMFPGHLVCHSDSFYIGQKIPALSAEEDLKMGHTYFVLPKQAFRSVLSFVSLASLISSSKVPAIPCSPLRFNARRTPLNPIDIQKGEGGGLRIKVCAEFIVRLMEDRRLEVKEQGNSAALDFRDERLCNTPKLQKDYTQLVTSRNHVWRPKLDTIREKENGRVGDSDSTRVIKSLDQQLYYMQFVFHPYTIRTWISWMKHKTMDLLNQTQSHFNSDSRL